MLVERPNKFDTPSGNLEFIPPAAQLRRSIIDAQQVRVASRIRKRHERERKRKLKHSLLTLKINRDWLIDVAVERGLLTERESENPVKRQAVLNTLQAEIEGVVADKVRSWRRQK
jgi:hypothetical protein